MANFMENPTKMDDDWGYLTWYMGSFNPRMDMEVSQVMGVPKS